MPRSAISWPSPHKTTASPGKLVSFRCIRPSAATIVIDAPPTTLFADASVLAPLTDGVLLVVRAGKTRYSTVEKLLDQMPRERLLGIVLNRTEEQPDSSSYYYQHRYYNREKRTTEMAVPPSSSRVEEEVATVN